MFGEFGDRARRTGEIRARHDLRSIVRRGRALAAAEETPLAEKYTAIDRRITIEAVGTEVDLGADRRRQEAKVKKKIARVAAKVERARMAETEQGQAYEDARRRHLSFRGRFPAAVELLARPREKGWKFLLPVACAIGVNFALDYPVMELLAPSVGAAGFPFPVDWILRNFPLVGTTSIAVAEAAMVAYAGKEAAWAWSPLPAEAAGPGEADEGSARGVVHSDRGRLAHRVGFVVLGLALSALLVALVALRVRALGLLAGLGGGGEATGIAGSLATTAPSQGGLGESLELLVIAGFPLLVAGWAAYLHESPLASSLADLARAESRASGKLASATRKRGALEARLVGLGEDLELVDDRCEADQFLARLFPHMVHEVLVEASPEFHGVVSDRPHPLLWRIEEPAGDRRRSDIAEILARWRAGSGGESERNGAGDHDEAAA
jgi:hypothetical protein